MENFKTLFLVGLGSFIGGVFRYLLSKNIYFCKPIIQIPWGTILVNVLGCFLIGIVSAFFDRNKLTVAWRVFFTFGILGGFTTFSAFSNETIFLLRTEQYTSAFFYAFITIFAGLCATFLGYLIISYFFK